MTPEMQLRLTLAAQRESAVTSALIQYAGTAAALTVQNPSIAGTLSKALETMGRSNSWEHHVAQIDELFEAAGVTE